MRQRISLIPLLLCLLMLMSLLPAAAFADDDTIDIVDELTDDTLISEAELDGELVELPEGPEAWRCPEEELRPFTGEYGWLQLELDRPLLEQVGHQRGGVACACYALAYCRTLLDGRAQPYSDFNLGNDENDAWCAWYFGDYESLNFTEAYEVYERMVKELSAGKPVVILVNGSRTQQHYVAIVGFENLRPGEPLTANNFLMLDPVAASFEPQNLGEAELDLKKQSNGVYQLVVDRSQAVLPLEAHRSSYLSLCRIRQACRSVETTRQALLRSLPCDSAADADSAQLAVLAEGERFQTSALVQNRRGEYWYRGVTDSGLEGYVSAADCSQGSLLYPGLSLSEVKMPRQLVCGEAFPIGGRLVAGGAAFQSITVEVYAGEAPADAPLLRATLPGECGFRLLEDSELAEALPFETLAEGSYCLILTASVTEIFSTDGATMQREEQDLLLRIQRFTVEAEPPAVDDLL